MKTYKIGVIGAHGRGRHAWQAHRVDKGFEIVMGADPFDMPLRDREYGHKSFCEEFPNATLVKDYREVLANKDIDIVFITSPDYCHEEQAVAALEAGKAVYLEKPMAITLEGCDRILRTAYRTKSKLFLGHNMRYFPSVLKMKEVIDSGMIGEIQCGWCRHFINYGGDAYFRDWHSEQKNTCGLLLQKGAHDIDVMHWLMGSSTRRVVGMGMLSVYDKCARRSADTEGNASWSNEHYPPLEQTGFSPVIDVEDHNMILMQLANGAQATYMQCHYSPDAERNYTFIGTKGRVENIGDSGKCEIHVWTARGPRETPDLVYHLKPATGSHGGADGPIVDNFLDFVVNGAKTNANPVAARDAVAAGVLAHYSMRKGNMPQEVPQLEPELLEYFANNQQ
ncbi:MAG: Gfo/Idh/MocA family oxidoreductase [Lentisphaeria bacterium]|nr:Gfo/Idh/MocA family oxidoreductase [Lentisphaeria bacterium]